MLSKLYKKPKIRKNFLKCFKKWTSIDIKGVSFSCTKDSKLKLNKNMNGGTLSFFMSLFLKEFLSKNDYKDG